MCPYCSSACTLFGKSSTGNQRYRCRNCKRTHCKEYIYKACRQDTGQWITRLNAESVSVRGIGRLLGISFATVQRKIISLSARTKKPVVVMGKEYELDELCTYIGSKANLFWLVYAIRKDTKEVVDFAIGKRTNATLQRVTDTLLLASATKVFTDRLKNYSYLLPKEVHCIKPSCSRYISGTKNRTPSVKAFKEKKLNGLQCS